MSDAERIKFIIEELKRQGYQVTELELLADGVRVKLLPLVAEDDPLEREKRERVELQNDRRERKRTLGLG